MAKPARTHILNAYETIGSQKPTDIKAKKPDIPNFRPKKQKKKIPPTQRQGVKSNENH